ncbi:MAG: desulfoferrodoxin [Thermoplasmata archaeon]
MTERLEVYRCNICGNIVEVVHEGEGELVCCGEPMELLEEKIEEEGNEKHLPVVKEKGDGISVKVGSVEHPMEEDHYIEWIEVLTEEGAFRKFLHPNEEPKVEFDIEPSEIHSIREYCNVHGLWKK